MNVYILIGSNGEPLEAISGAVYVYSSYDLAQEAARDYAGRVRELDLDAPSQEAYDSLETEVKELKESRAELAKAWRNLIGDKAWELAVPEEMPDIARKQAREVVMAEWGHCVSNGAWCEYLENVQP